jgi:hypothetical protein
MTSMPSSLVCTPSWINLSLIPKTSLDTIMEDHLSGRSNQYKAVLETSKPATSGDSALRSLWSLVVSVLASPLLNAV